MLYFFENFVLDPARRELRYGNALIALQPQAFDLLEYLITHRDHVVSKDDILQAAGVDGVYRNLRLPHASMRHGPPSATMATSSGRSPRSRAKASALSGGSGTGKARG